MKNPKQSTETGDPPAPEVLSQVSRTRRSFMARFALGALLLAIAGQAWAWLRALVPNVLYEEPKRMKIGIPDRFPEGATFLEDQHVFVVRERNTLYAISSTCTHLGCTVKMIRLAQPKKVKLGGQLVEEQREFHCPCHGSKYYGDGTNYSGPAPKPLSRYKLEVSPDDGQLIVDFSESVKPDFRLTV